ncbi:MAG: hypothetical protein K8M05_21945 [Deltaproteobacteria bacterium]|nr:hypothetical protein [Kofleriaceae bacterium]
MRRLAVLVGIVAVGGAACGKGAGGSKTEPAVNVPAPVVVAPDAATPDASLALSEGDRQGGRVEAPTPPAPPPPPAKPGADFIDDARLLYQLVACQDRGKLADEKKAKVVDRHCAWVSEQLGAYRAKYIVEARAFFDEIEPDDLPRTVVYPFGGGDLISSLAAFPEADETTTISLELAGDPRRIGALTARELDASLSRLRGELGGTLSVGSNTSENLSSSQRNDLPAQVSSFLLGLAAAGFEPVSMRYVRLEDDGAIHYLTADEIAAADGRATRARKGDWNDPNFSESFANVEIEYRKAGDPSDRVRVHRHFGWNLRDRELGERSQLLRHLEQKGKVTVLVKGASYLLWRNDFSRIRSYLLANLAWMLSDSTGIPPRFAREAGMVQETYGRFAGPFLEGVETSGKRHADDFRALWAKNKKRRLAFRFGYVDSAKQAHLVVTRPKP